jgi:membrane-bound lytic murein transglycosylase B
VITNPGRALRFALLLCVIAVASLLLVDGGGPEGTAPGDQRLAADPAAGAAAARPSPAELAADLRENAEALETAIGAWHARAGRPPGGQAPDPLIVKSRFLQKRARFLARRPGFARATIRRLDGPVARRVKTLTGAQRKLFKLAGGGKPRKLREGRPEPLANLVRYYRKAKLRYQIGVIYLAAINLVETKFGRVKSKSTAGAVGPMQFIPSTWRIYGKGNIRDPHDAIMAAARLLRDNGAPGSYKRALYAYNPSKLYVAAVNRYAKLIGRDRYALHFLYCWGP